MKWIRRLLVAALLVLILLIVGVGGLALYDSQMGEDSSAVSNVTFTAQDGTMINAYLAAPQGDGPYPAVIMVHEWWGLNAEITHMADLLAAEGYVVLAPDTYRGSMETTVPGALVLRLSADAARVDADMGAAYAFLAAQPQVDAARIAVMGFCYGGGVALRHGIDNPDVKAVINLYGDTVDDAGGFGALLQSRAPVLGIFGAEDQQIPLAEVEGFEAALAQTDIPHTVTVYDGVGHAFVFPESIEAGGAAQEAWAQILAFLGAHLQA